MYSISLKQVSYFRLADDDRVKVHPVLTYLWWTNGLEWGSISNLDAAPRPQPDVRTGANATHLSAFRRQRTYTPVHDWSTLYSTVHTVSHDEVPGHNCLKPSRSSSRAQEVIRTQNRNGKRFLCFFSVNQFQKIIKRGVSPEGEGWLRHFCWYLIKSTVQYQPRSLWGWRKVMGWSVMVLSQTWLQWLAVIGFVDLVLYLNLLSHHIS